jgi:hypothetical protein
MELDGSSAALVAGDILELTLAKKTAGDVQIDVVDVARPAVPVHISQLDKLALSRRLPIMLTDEPVGEPPPALYAALLRRTDTTETDDAPQPARLSLPLYAQLPLPWRVNLRDPKKDFRNVLVRRAATFVWSLVRPAAELETSRMHVVKVDRNGQTFLPEGAGDFLKARRVK